MARLIDADALVKELSGKYIVPVDEATRGVATFMGIQMRQAINNAPTIDAVPLEDYRSMEQTVHKLTQALAEAEPIKHGHWVYDDEAYPGGNPYGHYNCDQCGESVPHKTNYCPNCGAIMDEQQEVE